MLSRRPRPWSEAEVRLRARKKVGLSPSCLIVLPGLCPQAGRNDMYSCSCVITLKELYNSQGDRDRVLFSSTPLDAMASPGSSGTVAVWLRIKPRTTLASPSKI